jgi:hypothetical protein
VKEATMPATHSTVEPRTDGTTPLTVWIRTTKLDDDPDRPAERQVLRGLD